MLPVIDYTKQVRYELMHGRDASAAIAREGVGYLPIGCLERHGDHLPMGLDVIKAHGICCLAAQALGGVVFPPHYYSGIHLLEDTLLDRFTGEWGNLYTDATCEAHLFDVITQLARTGLRVLVLYSGHYPECQVTMIQELAARASRELPIIVIPFSDPMAVSGDHAGLSETSLMLFLDKTLVDMTRIGPENYRDHGWGGDHIPERATLAEGEAEAAIILEYLKQAIDAARG